ncbi:MAG: DUF3256 family protein [Bacteroidaceae bacterium]|nr:DUF3256 family protein [Bacteroidaceae bacterium]
MLGRSFSITLLLSGLLLMPLIAPAQTTPSQPQMRDVFAAMPDSLLPAVSKNNRLDCIDFIDNGLEAKVRNAFDDYVVLEALTSDYARFRTSASSVMEMKLLTADTTAVLCVVTTAQVDASATKSSLEDSNICLFNADWSPLSVRGVNQPSFSQIPLDAFLDARPDDASAYYDQALRALADFRPVKVSLSADEPVATLTLQTSQLSKEERGALGEGTHPVRLRWDGIRFIR